MLGYDVWSINHNHLIFPTLRGHRSIDRRLIKVRKVYPKKCVSRAYFCLLFTHERGERCEERGAKLRSRPGVTSVQKVQLHTPKLSNEGPAHPEKILAPALKVNYRSELPERKFCIFICAHN